ncbi:MAG: hypothetical protein H6722_17160 [Sandaracinus sp.]|nr:hypothetical protein [Sandaracinus sp.]MCB9614169.1 hypothetical protein [Sandaracinus sp.]MCB9620924.1 hypothetical protein [Sandaracinus sp.]MCB9621677.1 hypothetical protein [Sandaracinus sp.]MCB9621954.1 hypothetical protein [Sandaracinus sp.]
MEIFLDKRAVRQIRLSAADAIEEGDTETLREDLIEAFSEEQVEEIERRIDSGDIYEFISEVLDEWGGDDIEELFELLEGQLADADVDLKYTAPEMEDEEEEEEEEEDGEDDVEYEEEPQL